MNPYRRHHFIRELLTIALLLGSFSLPDGASAQSDDFTDNNDAGWTHYDPLGGLGAGPQAIFSVTNGVYHIKAIRNPAIPAQAGGARAGSTREGIIYTNFYIYVDLLAWDSTVNPDHAIGLLARIRNPGLGTTDGYAFTYQVADTDISISRLVGEAPGDLTGSSKNILLDTNKQYRFVFIGKGNAFEGRIYELPNLTTPIITTSGTDPSAFPDGTAGLVLADLSGSLSGSSDATFDNYFAQDVEPPKLSIAIGLFEGDITVSWPVETPDDFVLQGTTAFTSSTTWTDLTNNIHLSSDGTKKEYDDNSMSSGLIRFYRLRRP
jgi:hypothetical protein